MHAAQRGELYRTTVRRLAHLPSGADPASHREVRFGTALHFPVTRYLGLDSNWTGAIVTMEGFVEAIDNMCGSRHVRILREDPGNL
jgi:hypothetical protein